MTATDPAVAHASFAAVAITEAPRWARMAAHVTALLAVPSGLWRVGLALGFPLGHTEQGLRDLVGTTWWGPASLVALSVLCEAAALLTLGLVRRWGVITPRWIPFAGGRIIPRRAVLVAAWTGVAILTALWTPFLFWWAMPGDGMTPTGQLVIGFLYLPLVAWAPLLAAVTLSYQRRRR
ncbi:hypothetical protein [Lentzea sp. E54]|uniref:hypothetical protein n=1 Tax=Lentzea xerophila TaxID=3435883 RepID=UPI003DA45B89